MKRIEDFYLEEIVLFQIQQHIMELGESDKLLQEERNEVEALVDSLKKRCRASERAIEKVREKRLAEFEAYALGDRESYDAPGDDLKELKGKAEELKAQLAEAEERLKELSRKKVHECFAVTKLTKELLDEYVEGIAVYGNDDVRITWK